MKKVKKQAKKANPMSNEMKRFDIALQAALNLKEAKQRLRRCEDVVNSEHSRICTIRNEASEVYSKLYRSWFCKNKLMLLYMEKIDRSKVIERCVELAETKLTGAVKLLNGAADAFRDAIKDMPHPTQEVFKQLAEK